MNFTIDVSHITQAMLFLSTLGTVPRSRPGEFEHHIESNYLVYSTAMYQCLDLIDITENGKARFSDTEVLSATMLNESTLRNYFHWCKFGKLTWFPTAFYAAYDNSWQKIISIHFTLYIFPIMVSCSFIGLLVTVVGARILSRRLSDRQPRFFVHHQYSIDHIPATWPLLYWFCIFGLIWLVLFGGGTILQLYLPKQMNPLETSTGCRIMNYLKVVLRYIPTWLLCVLLCDRAFGEYRAGVAGPNPPSSTRPPYYVVSTTNGSDNEDNPNTSADIASPGGTLLLKSNGKFSSKMNNYYERRVQKMLQNKVRLYSVQTKGMSCRCTTPRVLRFTYYTPTCCLNPNPMTRKVFKEQAESSRGGERPIWVWPEVGFAKIGGHLLAGTTIAGICVLNTHLLWLYAVKGDHGTCSLTSGKSVLLGSIYPLILHILQAIVPIVLMIISLINLTILAIRRSRVQEHQSRHFLSYPPTQVSVVLSLVSLVFELPDIYEWIHLKVAGTSYPLISALSTAMQLSNQTEFSDPSSILLSQKLHSSAVLRHTMANMKSNLLFSFILRTWVNQRFLFVFLILIRGSSQFREAVKYAFQKSWERVRNCVNLRLYVRRVQPQSDETDQPPRQECSSACFCCLCAFHS